MIKGAEIRRLKSLWEQAPRPLVKLFGLGMLIFGFGKLVQIALQIVLARSLSAEGFGLLNIALNLSQILAIVLALGVPSAGMRWVAVLAGREDWGQLRGYLLFVLRYLGTVSTVVIFGSVAFALVQTDSERRTFGLIMAIVLPATTIGIARAGLLRGFHVMGGALTPREIIAPLLAILLIPLFARGDVLIAGTLYGLAFLLAELVGFVWLKRHIPGALDDVAPVFRVREWLRVSLPIQAASLARMVLQRADILYVGALLGLEEAAVYAVAHRLAQSLSMIGRIASQSVSPMLARAYHAEQPGRVLILTLQAIVLTLVFVVPVFALLVVGAPYLVGLFGDTYQGAVPVLIILAVGQMSNAVFGPAAQALMMTEFERLQLGLVVACGSLALVLQPIMTAQAGLIGAAATAAGLLLLLNLSSYVIGFRHLRRALAIRETSDNQPRGED